MVNGHEGSSHVSPTIFDTRGDGGLSRDFEKRASISTFKNHNGKRRYKLRF